MVILDPELRIEILHAAYIAAMVALQEAMTARVAASKAVNAAWLEYRLATGEHLNITEM